MKVLRFIYRYLGPIIAINALIEMTIFELTRLYFLHNLMIAPIILPWLKTWIPIFTPTIVTLPFYYRVIISQDKAGNKIQSPSMYVSLVLPILYFIPMTFYVPYQQESLSLGVLFFSILTSAVIITLAYLSLSFIERKRCLLRWVLPTIIGAVVLSITTAFLL